MRFLFALYDADGDGLLQRADIAAFVKQVAPFAFDGRKIDSLVEKTFEEQTTFAEFVRVLKGTDVLTRLRIRLQ